METGKTYYYESRGGEPKCAVLIRTTKAWYIFSNGDWVERYRPIYRSLEEYQLIKDLVKAMKQQVHVPDVIHVPNRFLR